MFDSELIDSEVYSVFRRDRETTTSDKRTGGGVLIAVKNRLGASLVPQFLSDAEDLWVKITIGSTRVFLCCVYLPPGDSGASASFSSKLSSLKNDIERDVVVMCGDFNCSSIRWIGNPDANNSFFEPNNVEAKYSDLIDALSVCELMQFNSVVNNNNRILDLLLCNQFLLSQVTPCNSPLVGEDKHHPSLEFMLKLNIKYLSKSSTCTMDH